MTTLTEFTHETIKCSVGITAHNEEANIAQILEAMLNQRLHMAEIAEIIVVASGCTDHTIDIVQEYMALDSRIQLFIQEKREGKTSAINIFLKHATTDVCVLESGDTVPHEDAIENMVRMFHDPAVGMTGAHKVPVNTPEHIIGFLSHLRLKMEHQLCLDIPRLGELIAFRKVFDQIPPDVAMDEAFVEALVIRRGLQVRYAPDAVVFNMGPETLGGESVWKGTFSPEDQKALIREHSAITALGRLAKPKDVAMAVLFLASDVTADHITGIVIGTDGGQYYPH